MVDLAPILPGAGLGTLGAPAAPPIPQVQFSTPPGTLPPIGADQLPAGTFNPNVPPPVGRHGLASLITGFGGNVVHGLEGLATGLSSVIGMGLHDVGRLAVGHPDHLEIPTFLKALPGGIAHQYSSFYGPLLAGNIGQFVHNVYEDPVQPLLDTLGASSIVGKAAVGVGLPGAVARATGLSPGALAAREAFAAGGVASDTYQAVKAAQAAGEPEIAARLLVDAQKAAGIPQWVRKVAPGIGTEFPGGFRYIQTGNEFRPVGYTYSPVKRFALEKPLDRILTTPVEAYEKRIRDIGFDPLRSNELARLQGIVGRARELGMRRLDYQPVQDFRLRRAADTLFALHGTRLVERREALLTRFAAVFKGLTDVDLANAHLNFLGIDVVPEKFRAAFEPEIRRYYDQSGRAVISGVPTPAMLAKEPAYREAMAVSAASSFVDELHQREPPIAYDLMGHGKMPVRSPDGAYLGGPGRGDLPFPLYPFPPTDELLQRMALPEEETGLLRDRQGRPVRVYHGTRAGHFPEFKTSEELGVGRGLLGTNVAYVEHALPSTEPGEIANEFTDEFWAASHPSRAGEQAPQVRMGYVASLPEHAGRSPNMFDFSEGMAQDEYAALRGALLRQGPIGKPLAARLDALEREGIRGFASGTMRPALKHDVYEELVNLANRSPSVHNGANLLNDAIRGAGYDALVHDASGASNLLHPLDDTEPRAGRVVAVFDPASQIKAPFTWAERRAIIARDIAAGKPVRFTTLSAFPDLPGGQRARFMHDLVDATRRTAVHEDQTHMAMFLWDKIAASAVKHRPELFGTEDAFYAHLAADFRTEYERHPIERFYKLVASRKSEVLDAAEQRLVRELAPQIGPITRELNRWLPQGWPQPWSDAHTAGAIRMAVLDARRSGEKLTASMLRSRVEAGVNGLMRFGSDGYAFLRLFGNANLGTLVHEGAHLIRKILPEDDMAALEDVYGIDRGEAWPKAAEERFARDAERYLETRQVPPGSAAIWEQIRSVLVSLYAKLRDYMWHKRMVDPVVRDVLERWLGPTTYDESLVARVHRAGYDSPVAAKWELAHVARTTPSWGAAARAARLRWDDRASILLDHDPSAATPEDRLGAELAADGAGRIADGTSTDLPPRRIARPAFEQTTVGTHFTLPAGSPDAPARPVVPLDPEALRVAGQTLQADAARIFPGGVAGHALEDIHEVVPDDPFMGTSQAHLVIAVTMPEWASLPTYRAHASQLGTIVGVHDFASAPHELGYRGVHYDVERPDGSVVQVRVHTPLSWRAARAATKPLHPGDTPVVDLVRFARAEHDAIERTIATGRGPRGEEVSRQEIAALQQRQAEVAREMERGLPFVQSLFEPVVAEMHEQLNGIARSELDRVREDARLLTHEELTSSMLGKTLTLGDAFDRQYLPLRMATGATMDYKTLEWVGGSDPLDIHYQRQSAGMHTPIYFPLQDATQLRFTDYLLGKNLVGMRTSSRGRYTRRATGGAIEKGSYVTNPTEVFQRRAAQQIRMAETWDMVREVIARYSRNLNEEAERHFAETGVKIDPRRLVSEEERLFAPDGLLRFFRGKIALDDWLAHATAAGAEEDAAMKAALQQILPAIHDDVRHYLGVSRTDIPLYSIPKVVAEQLEKQISLGMFQRGKGVRLFWNRGTDVWKSMVLVGSPRWIANNLIGNIVFLKMQGGKITDVLRQFDPSYRRLWEDTLGTQPGIDTGLYRSQETYRIKAGAARARPSSATANSVEQMRKWWTESLPGKGLHNYSRIIVRLNAANETAFRRASYMAAARQIGQEVGLRTAYRSFWDSKNAFETISAVGASPRLTAEAMDRMNYFMNDYQKLSPWARHVIKPFIFPFWTFYRHVAKLMLTMPLANPDRLQLINQLAKVGNEMTAGYGPLPPFLQGAVVWGPSPDPKKVRFLNTNGPNPFNAIFNSPLDLLHPLLKSALEEATGRTALSGFGTTFSAPDVVTPFGSSQQYRVAPDGSVTPVSHVAPSILEELLRQIPQYQLAEGIAAGGTPYSTTSLLHPQARLGATGERLYPADPAQALLKLLGFSTTDYNVANYQARIQHDEQAALVLRLRELGLLPPAAGAPLQPIVPAPGGQGG